MREDEAERKSYLWYFAVLLKQLNAQSKEMWLHNVPVFNFEAIAEDRPKYFHREYSSTRNLGRPTILPIPIVPIPQKDIEIHHITLITDLHPSHILQL